MKRRKNIPNCNGELVLYETLPSQLEFEHLVQLPSIGEGILALLKTATKSIDVSSFYISLINIVTEPIPSDVLGKKIYDELLGAAGRGVKIRIVVTLPSKTIPEDEVLNMAKKFPDFIEVRFLDMPTISETGGGINHTKLYLVDENSFYLGSANCDWRAYSEVAEIGIIGKNCLQSTLDLKKIFDMYWIGAKSPKDIPKIWPECFATKFNLRTPMQVTQKAISLFFSVSPSPFLTKGRTDDLDAILNIINLQKKGVLRLGAMAFSNLTSFEKKNYFWGKIDFALRKATMERDVEVFLMVDDAEFAHYKVKKALESLQGYNKIYAKIIKFPHLPVEIPFARLFHSKLVISDNAAWLGTSNLQPSYFIDTTGIGCTFVGSNSAGADIIETLKSYYDRYYHSKYTRFVDQKKPEEEMHKK